MGRKGFKRENVLHSGREKESASKNYSDDFHWIASACFVYFFLHLERLRTLFSKLNYGEEGNIHRENTPKSSFVHQIQPNQNGENLRCSSNNQMQQMIPKIDETDNE